MRLLFLWPCFGEAARHHEHLLLKYGQRLPLVFCDVLVAQVKHDSK
ncbi:hypothetical protein STIAU_1325 [Stigmatella aurantiaca DW4/3-1]|uniref:Uncharacterized protein n=1 Tax=Stigmatella aurantiaca (strain DW4/3-1) TaxID=378806 RepID=Q08M58_STIAD|nr:hypothetical protein STIAU_1325 [Stigmatella aurantiaca DW4/3-1]